MVTYIHRVLTVLLLFLLKQCTPYVTECPPNSVQLNEEGFCYEIYLNKNVPYKEAEQFCSERNGTLPIIRNEENLLFLLKLHARQKLGNYWIGMNKTNNQWRYVSNDQPVNHNMGKTENQNFYNCGAVFAKDDYRWGSERCDSKLRYICQFPENVCGNSSCYKISNGTASFRMAIINCKNLGGELAETRNTSNHEEIVETIRANKDWINITDEKVMADKSLNSESFWSKALYDSKMGTWKNSTYINQLPVFRNKTSIPEMKGRQCVTFQKLNNVLRNCTNLNNIICQFEIINEYQVAGTELGTETTAAEIETTVAETETPIVLRKNETHDSTINHDKTASKNATTVDTTAHVEDNRVVTKTPTLQPNSTVSNETSDGVKESSPDWKSLAIAAFVVCGCVLFIGIIVILIKFVCGNRRTKRVYKRQYKKVANLQGLNRGQPHDAVRMTVVRRETEEERQMNKNQRNNIYTKS